MQGPQNSSPPSEKSGPDGARGSTPPGRPGATFVHRFWSEVREGAEHFHRHGRRIPKGPLRQFIHGLSLPFHVARATLDAPARRRFYLRVGLLQTLAAVALAMMVVGSGKEAVKTVEKRTVQRRGNEYSERIQKRAADVEAAARAEQSGQDAGISTLGAVVALVVEAMGQDIQETSPAPPPTANPHGPTNETRAPGAPSEEDIESPKPPATSGAPVDAKPAAGPRVRIQLETDEDEAPNAGEARNMAEARTEDEASPRDEARTTDEAQDEDEDEAGDKPEARTEASARHKDEAQRASEARHKGEAQRASEARTEDEAGNEDVATNEAEEDEPPLSGLSGPLRYLAYLAALWAALHGAQWVVIGLSRDYHTLISRDASLATGITPEDEPFRPRVRLNFSWMRRKLKQRIRGMILFAVGVPALALLSLGLLPFGLQEVALTVLSALWGFWWWMVFTAGKSQRAWELPPEALRPPWFVRLWTALTTRVPGFRWGFLQGYGRFWSRRTQAVSSPMTSAEGQPWAFAGLTVTRAIGSLPPFKLFMRPFIPVASAHLLAETRPQAAGAPQGTVGDADSASSGPKKPPRFV